jgi:anti-sigma factor RsiW
VTHLDQPTMELLLDGELAPDRAAAARAHVAACGACAARLEAVEREEKELGNLLQLLDHEPPRRDLAAVLAAARPRRRSRGWIAASVALLIAAGGLWAIPGSPVREWLHRAVGTEPASTGETGGADVSGIAIVPEGPLEVSFVAAEGPIDVMVVPSDTLTVRVLGPPASIASDDGRLVVTGGGSGARYEVLVPRLAASVRIVVGERTVWTKTGQEIETDAPADAEGRTRLN